MKSNIMHPADQICMVMKMIYDRNMTSLTGGNLSIMDDEGVMWVSPSGIDKGNLRREDIVRVFPDGSTEGIHKPTSEYRIHKRIFEVCPGMKAVLHAHSPAMVAMSVAYQVPDTSLTVAAYDACRNPGLAQYATPGTIDLVESVGTVFSAGHNAAVLKNHAVFVGSRIDLFDGMKRLEQLEKTAQMQMCAGTVGTPSGLKKDSLAAYYEARERVSGKDESANNGSAGYSVAEREIRRNLVLFVKRAYEKNLFSGMYGTMSARIADSAFVISPKDKDNAYIVAKDFVRVENGQHESGKLPDRDWQLHQEIYRLHPDVQCIMTAAPVYLSSYSVSGADYPVEIAPESYGVLREGLRFSFQSFIDITPIAEKISLTQPFALIENMGVIVAGPDMTLTFDKMEVAEYSAQSLHMVRNAGFQLYPLTKEQLLLTDIH